MRIETNRTTMEGLGNRTRTQFTKRISFGDVDSPLPDYHRDFAEHAQTFFDGVREGEKKADILTKPATEQMSIMAKILGISPDAIKAIKAGIETAQKAGAKAIRLNIVL